MMAQADDETRSQVRMKISFPETTSTFFGTFGTRLRARREQKTTRWGPPTLYKRRIGSTISAEWIVVDLPFL